MGPSQRTVKMIPVLNVVCCGCSLRNGCIFIGIAMLYLGDLQLMWLFDGVQMVSDYVYSTDDKTLGETVINIVSGEDERTNPLDLLQGENFVELLDPELAKMLKDEPVYPANLGKHVKEFSKVFTPVLYVVLFSCLFFFTLVMTVLLIGIFKKKPSCVLFYLVVNIVCSILSLPVIYNFYYYFQFSAIVCNLVNLCCLWVVYSFYRELLQLPKRPDSSTIILLPGQEYLVENGKGKGDNVPIAITREDNDDYHYPLKFRD